jgi:mRNA interferase YafQ
MNRLKEAMLLLIANDGPLGPEWKDHPLTGGDWIGHRECHIGGISCWPTNLLKTASLAW